MFRTVVRDEFQPTQGSHHFNRKEAAGGAGEFGVSVGLRVS